MRSRSTFLEVGMRWNDMKPSENLHTSLIDLVILFFTDLNSE